MHIILVVPSLQMIFDVQYSIELQIIYRWIGAYCYPELLLFYFILFFEIHTQLLVSIQRW